MNNIPKMYVRTYFKYYLIDDYLFSRQKAIYEIVSIIARDLFAVDWRTAIIIMMMIIISIID